jgi:hypothetical protein
LAIGEKTADHADEPHCDADELDDRQQARIVHPLNVMRGC